MDEFEPKPILIHSFFTHVWFCFYNPSLHVQKFDHCLQNMQHRCVCIKPPLSDGIFVAGKILD